MRLAIEQWAAESESDLTAHALARGLRAVPGSLRTATLVAAELSRAAARAAEVAAHLSFGLIDGGGENEAESDESAVDPAA